MNEKLTKKAYPLLALALGLCGAGCRFLLYATGVDAKGLLVPGHPAAWVLGLLTAAAALMAALAWRLSREDDKAPDDPGRGLVPALGSAVMALGALSVVLLPESGGIPALLRIHRLLSVAAAVCLLAAAGFRLRGKPVPFGCSALAAVFLFIHVVSRYRAWSGDPQVMDYLFSLGAGLCLTLTAYYETALAVGLGGRRLRLALGTLGIFFCFTAAARGEYPALHLCGGLWLLAMLLTARPGERLEGADL